MPLHSNDDFLEHPENQSKSTPVPSISDKHKDLKEIQNIPSIESPLPKEKDLEPVDMQELEEGE